MKNILFSAFKFIFKDQISKEILNANRNIESEFRIKREEEKNKCKEMELEMLIGKPVISISNEWCNPVIGFGKEVIYITKAKIPVLVIKNYLTGEENMSLSDPFYFTEQRFNALAKLDPFEICSIIYKNSTTYQPFEKKKSGIFDGYEVIKKTLEKNGFFDKVKLVKN